jgi:hypothetical protein
VDSDCDVFVEQAIAELQQPAEKLTSLQRWRPASKWPRSVKVASARARRASARLRESRAAACGSVLRS